MKRVLFSFMLTASLLGCAPAYEVKYNPAKDIRETHILVLEMAVKNTRLQCSLAMFQRKTMDDNMKRMLTSCINQLNELDGAINNAGAERAPALKALVAKISTMYGETLTCALMGENDPEGSLKCVQAVDEKYQNIGGLF